MEDEKDIVKYLKKIANSIGLVLLWMIINLFFGLYLNWAYFEGGLHWQNGVFYAWFFLSLFALVMYIRHAWQKHS